MPKHHVSVPSFKESGKGLGAWGALAHRATLPPDQMFCGQPEDPSFVLLHKHQLFRLPYPARSTLTPFLPYPLHTATPYAPYENDRASACDTILATAAAVAAAPAAAGASPCSSAAQELCAAQSQRRPAPRPGAQSAA